MKRTIKYKFLTSLSLFAILISVLSLLGLNASASTSSDGENDLIAGQVEVISPQVIVLKTDSGIVNVDVVDINVENMDVQFLQIGDTMIVAGEYESKNLFDAEALIDIEPFS